MGNGSVTAAVEAEVRKERIHTTMLIEVLSLLVFMSMAFAFVMKEEGDRTNPWKEVADRYERQIKSLKVENKFLEARLFSLQRQIEALEASIKRLVAAHQGPLAANDKVVVIPKAVFEGMSDKQGNSDQMVAELQREVASLRRRLQTVRGKGGVDLPNCPVTAGFLANVDLYGDGAFRVQPTWNKGAVDAAVKVPGLIALTSGKLLNRSQFQMYAGEVAQWGKKQAVPCGFRVRVLEHHVDLNLYKRQVGLVEQSFYVRRK